ncbi:MAG: 4Fe-4S binding protein [Candidatus Lokiarchaeota archaeon]|nr:4Fe-4S binding protein [Candidatus Lokiarchaeota archaeon]
MTQAPTNETDDPYRALQEHLDTLPVPYPATQSGVEISLLKRIFTPDEARIASRLNCSWENYENLDSIHERLKDLGYSKKELEEKLDAMLLKGGLMGYQDDSGQKSYSNAPLVVGMFEFQVNKVTEGFVRDFFSYMKEGWVEESNKVQVPQLRVVPIGTTVEHKSAIFTYDDIKRIVAEAEGPFSLQNCICRQMFDLLGKPCKNTKRREVCVGWGKGASMYIKAGWGKEITREQVIETLKENEKEGMILQVSNAQHPEFVCSCCTCCDPMLSFLKKLPTPATFIQGNYVARNDPELCTGCATCVDRCPMTAITVKDGESRATIDHYRCIGCGNCVAACPNDAIRLEKKSWESLPPPTVVDLYDAIGKERNRLREKEQKRKERLAKKVRDA